MDTQTRIDIIKNAVEEIITEQELIDLLKTKKKPIAYDGFEPSGRIHIAQGLMRAITINEFLKAGVHFKLWIADWFAWMNNKLDGDLNKIRTVGNYFIEVWRASGVEMDKVEVLWAKDVMADEEYWKKVINIARHTTVKRILRCSQIMGRKENEALSAAQVIYPSMQCADIFNLKVDIAQLGMDQRKVNMLAREIGPKLGYWKPIAAHHHMLMGLGQPASNADSAIDRAIDLKMSKSKPDSAVFMDDSFEEIKRKIKNAYCPPKQVDENPLMEYCKYIIFKKIKTVKIERSAKFGGNLEISSYDELTKIYEKGNLHPLDLKNSVATHINDLIEPVRKHFKTNSKAKKLYEEVKNYKITR